MATHLFTILKDWLRKHGSPVMSEYGLFLAVARQHRAVSATRVAKRSAKASLSRVEFGRLRNRLLRNEVIEADGDFRSGVFRLVGAPALAAEAACCLVDPFCYVSHLSAMQHYGLTDRSPTELSLTTPELSVWNAHRDERMRADLEETLQLDVKLGHAEWVTLVRYGFTDEIRGRRVARHETKYPDTPIAIRDTPVRIAAIGRTFVDMLADPAWCGGMNHVLDVWAESAATYLEEIVAAVDRSPSAIVKVRAGYLLQERLRLAHPGIDAWKAFAARGSSRKLDPERPFDARHSEAWMLSLNV